MQALEDFMNALTDMDWGWQPFLFLRPAKNERMDNWVLSKISLYFGPVSGIAGYLGFLLASGQSFSILILLILIIVGIIVFFVLYKYTFAIAWNRRAERLQHEVAASKKSF